MPQVTEAFSESFLYLSNKKQMICNFLLAKKLLKSANHHQCSELDKSHHLTQRANSLSRDKQMKLYNSTGPFTNVFASNWEHM